MEHDVHDATTFDAGLDQPTIGLPTLLTPA